MAEPVHASAGDGSPALCVTVAYSAAPRQVWLRELRVAPGSTAAQVLDVSGLWTEFADLAGTSLHVSCWGRRCRPDDPVRDGDRIEVCRPLRADPKKARRERFAAQGARTAGLFAKRRPGAKAGY